ncbi:MAG TPA: hypothetical protein VII76_06875 [Acidimicrobiales bacterium]
MKKMIATVTVGLALSGVAGIGLSAGLATPAGAATPSAVAGPSTAARHPLRAWLRAHRKALARDTVRISAKTIGITPKDLLSTLRSGQSIAEVAQAHNVDVQTVVSALVQAADTQVGQAVDNHKLTQAQADKIEAVLLEAVTKVVNHVYGHSAS